MSCGECLTDIRLSSFKTKYFTYRLKKVEKRGKHDTEVELEEFVQEKF